MSPSGGKRPSSGRPRGRPAILDDGVRRSVQIERSMLARLAAIAQRRGVLVADLIREAVATWLRR